MKPLLYILVKTLKNTIKELKKKPAVLIFYIILAALLVFSITVTLLVPRDMPARGSAESYGMIAGGVLLMVTYTGIMQGVNSGSTFFRFSDVNFLFTAPISPRKVMVYGFIKQLGTILVILVFLAFQIPNLTMNFPLKSHGIAVIYGGAFLLMISMPLIGMLVYSLTSISPVVRSRFKKGINILVFLVLACFLFALYRTGNIIEAGRLTLNSKYFEYIPYIGWLKAVFGYAASDIDGGFYINLTLVVVFFIAIAYTVYRLETDYYEDVLAATERREELIRIKKEGRGSINYTTKKFRKVHQSYEGSGAKAVFYRHMLEYRKSGFFFIDKGSLVVTAVGAASGFFMPGAGLNYVLFFSIYLLFFLSIQGKWVQELGKPYIYLIPDSPERKLFYATLPESLKNGVDGLLLFTVAGIMQKADIITILLCAVCYMTYGAIYTYGDILSRRIFGSVHSKNLAVFVKMFIVFCIILPGIIVFAVMNIVLGSIPFISYLSYITLLVYNLVVSIAILFLNRGIFEHLEMN